MSFDKVTNYEEIKTGTQNASQITVINELLRLAKMESVFLVREIDSTWNQTYDSILLMYQKLVDLGLEIND